MEGLACILQHRGTVLLRTAGLGFLYWLPWQTNLTQLGLVSWLGLLQRPKTMWVGFWSLQVHLSLVNLVSGIYSLKQRPCVPSPDQSLLTVLLIRRERSWELGLHVFTLITERATGGAPAVHGSWGPVAQPSSALHFLFGSHSVLWNKHTTPVGSLFQWAGRPVAAIMILWGMTWWWLSNQICCLRLSAGLEEGEKPGLSLIQSSEAKCLHLCMFLSERKHKPGILLNHIDWCAPNSSLRSVSSSTLWSPCL